MTPSTFIRRAEVLARLARRRASAELAPLVCPALGPARQAVAQVRARLEAAPFGFAREETLRVVSATERELDRLAGYCPPAEEKSS